MEQLDMEQPPLAAGVLFYAFAFSGLCVSMVFSMTAARFQSWIVFHKANTFI